MFIVKGESVSAFENYQKKYIERPSKIENPPHMILLYLQNLPHCVKIFYTRKFQETSPRKIYNDVNVALGHLKIYDI